MWQLLLKKLKKGVALGRSKSSVGAIMPMDSWELEGGWKGRSTQ